jgi:hypothetical protein
VLSDIHLLCSLRRAWVQVRFFLFHDEQFLVTRVTAHFANSVEDDRQTRWSGLISLLRRETSAINKTLLWKTLCS